jgi:hypothetical protein
MLSLSASGTTIDPDDPTTFAGWRVAVIDGYDYYGPIAEYIAANREDTSIVQYSGGICKYQHRAATRNAYAPPAVVSLRTRALIS